MKALPNLLTLSRIALGAVVFLLLAAGAGALPGQSGPPSGGATLIWTSEVLFVLAAVTDYFDGWLARTLNAASPWGAILDPIADKIAVAAAILGLTVLAPLGAVPLPGFLILFREVLVSGLREGVGPRGIKIPVTGLAKWKTTVQLVALAMEIAATQASFGSPLRLGADVMLWAAAILTLWTGAGYIRAARLALK